MAFIDKGRQLYAEAFPCIEIVVAERHFKRGDHVCQWFNEHKLRVGAIRIEEFGADKLKLRYLFYGTINVEKIDDEITIDLTRKDRGDFSGRPMMICPDCAQEREKLFFVERLWRCHICHDLTSVKKLFNNATQWGRRVLFLDTEISLGRPKGMQARTFQKKLDELAALESRRVPNWWFTDHYYLQVPQWLRGNEIPSFKAPPKHWGYNWKPSEDLGFQRLYWRRQSQRWHPSEVERKERRLEAERAKRRKKDSPEEEAKPAPAETAPFEQEPRMCWFGDVIEDDEQYD